MKAASAAMISSPLPLAGLEVKIGTAAVTIRVM